MELEVFNYAFVRNALTGSVLACVVCAMIGTYIVTRRLVFISGGVTHASFGGIGIGLYADVSPLLCAAVFSVLSSCCVNWLSRREQVREDSAIAMLWTFGMAVGIFFSYLTPGYIPDLSVYLFGNILMITGGDLVMLLCVAVSVFLFFLFNLNRIISVSFDRDFAGVSGVNVVFIEYAMAILTSVSIVACLRLVGIVLVMSLLTIPQMTASLFTDSYRRIMLLSFVFALAGCMGGLILSFKCNVPSGASIIFVLIGIYVVFKGVAKIKDRSRTIKSV